MAQFTKNERFDPYKNFKFRVFFGRSTEPVAEVSKVGGLKRSTQVVMDRKGGDPSPCKQSPGRTEFEAITLERGVSLDTEFVSWANKVWNFANVQAAGDQRIQEVPEKDFRRDIIIHMYNEAGQALIAYEVYRCWVSEYQALPEFDANTNAVAIQSIKLENEGWQRVQPPEEPQEPSF